MSNNNINNDTSGNTIIPESNTNTTDVLNVEMNQLNTTSSNLLNSVIVDDIPNTNPNNKESKEFVIFKNELESLINNNLYILNECKANKRLLDIKYS